MYLVIFLTISLAFVSFSGQSSTSFLSKKPSISVINHDSGKFSKSFTDYLSENADLVPISEDSDAKKEALFFGSTSFIITIPKNFSDDFFSGKSPQLKFQDTPNPSSTQAKLLAENYLRLAKIHQLSGADQSKSTTKIENKNLHQDDSKKVAQFFNFSAYTIIILNILVISTIMLSFHTNAEKRNRVSPIPYGKIHSQIFLGNSIFSILTWALFIILSTIISPEIMLSTQGALFALNSFIFSLVGLSIGNLIGTIVKNRNAISGLTNVIGLGMAFIGGVFVPQEFLGSAVISIAKFLPTYWFVNSNTLIHENPNLNQTLILNLSITLAFAAIISIITKLINKTKLS